MDRSRVREKLTNLKEAALRSRQAHRLSPLESLLLSFTSGERILLYGLTALFAISALILLVRANNAVSVIVPSSGGTMTEGVIGTPRFINPLLAISEVDRDLAALMYSGLMRTLPSGEIIPDLAKSYTISEDGTTYTFTIRGDAYFHDMRPVTSADVLYTIERAQDPQIKSPRRADWSGVEISTPDEHTVVFKLPAAYAPFLEDTTMGVLPKHLWQDVSANEFSFHMLNVEPVGSGPYKLEEIRTSDTGTPEEYKLARFSRFTLGTPYLSKIVFVFYPNENALMRAVERGDIDSYAHLTPVQEGLSSGTIFRSPLERIFAIFFNQNQATMLSDASARRALSLAVDKHALITNVLSGYGTPLSSPFPSSMLRAQSLAPVDKKEPAARIEEARAILASGGWKWSEEARQWTKGKNTLTLTLSTADTPQLVATAEVVAGDWRAIGADVDVEIHSLSELNTDVIRPRKYDAILFGEVVGPSLDLFAFWHSSQRNDPGLNLALYANTNADRLLTTARATNDREKREELYASFAETLANDAPAVFLYAPDFVYVIPEGLLGVQIGAITTPSDRFANVYEWHKDVERVWEFFAK